MPIPYPGNICLRDKLNVGNVSLASSVHASPHKIRRFLVVGMPLPVSNAPFSCGLSGIAISSTFCDAVEIRCHSSSW